MNILSVGHTDHDEYILCIKYHAEPTYQLYAMHKLTLNFLVALVNTLNTKTHSSKEMAEFCYENADAESICYCK